MERTRHSFKHASLEERIAAVAIAHEMGTSEIEAWRQYIELEELPRFFLDFADRCGEESENHVDELLARRERGRKTAAADVSSRILRSETPADDNETAGAGSKLGEDPSTLQK